MKARQTSSRMCAYHGAELALSAGVAKYTDPQRKVWQLDYGKRSAVVPNFFVVKSGSEVMILHYSDISCAGR
jgi:hypothetical protein